MTKDDLLDFLPGTRTLGSRRRPQHARQSARRRTGKVTVRRTKPANYERPMAQSARAGFRSNSPLELRSISPMQRNEPNVGTQPHAATKLNRTLTFAGESATNDSLGVLVGWSLAAAWLLYAGIEVWAGSVLVTWILPVALVSEFGGPERSGLDLGSPICAQSASADPLDLCCGHNSLKGLPTRTRKACIWDR